jgi:hypothetical protein
VTGKTQHLVAVATLGEVEGIGAPGVGPVRGSDGESESVSKGTMSGLGASSTVCGLHANVHSSGGVVV